MLIPLYFRALSNTGVDARYCFYSIYGYGAKNLALLQNQLKLSQLGKLIIFIREKIIYKGKNYSLKLQQYYFCTRALLKPILFLGSRFPFEERYFQRV